MDKEIFKQLLTITLLLVLLKEGYTMPVEKLDKELDPRCKPGQRQRGNETVSICCNPATCWQIFDKCNETDTDDVCVPCGEGYCSRIEHSYSTLHFEESPWHMCDHIKKFCDGMAGTEPIIDDQGCIVDCKCKDGYFGYQKESRECERAMDPCHRKGVELSDNGVCMDCPTNKFKNFTVGKCINKSVCGPGDTMVDVGSTKTDVTCQMKSDQKPASTIPPADISDASRSQESTTEVDDSVANTGSNMTKTQTGKTVTIGLSYEWVIFAVVVILSFAVVAVILKDHNRRQRIYLGLSQWKECKCCPCKKDNLDHPNREANNQALSNKKASEEEELSPMIAKKQINDNSVTSSFITSVDSVEYPVSNEKRNSSAENLSRDDSGISNEHRNIQDPHKSRNPDETMNSLHSDDQDDTKLSILLKEHQTSYPSLSNKDTVCTQSMVYDKPEEPEQRKVTDAVKDEIDDKSDKSRDLSQLPDDVNSEQSIPDAKFRASNDSQAPPGAPLKTLLVGIVEPMKSVLQNSSPNVQPQQAEYYEVENTVMVFSNGASRHHGETRPQELPEPGQDNYLSPVPPLFTETDSLLESQNGHADENSEDETFPKEI